MGITFTIAKISNAREPRPRVLELEFLIDTGAIYSVVPSSIARKLALPKLDRQEFTLADGTHRAYDVGEAFFELGDRRGTSKVVFGPPQCHPVARAACSGDSRPHGESHHPRGLADALVPGLVSPRQALRACDSLWTPALTRHVACDSGM